MGSSDPRLRRPLAALALAACLPGTARADVLSPGPLSRAHQSLEGLANCTRCHVAGQQLPPETCLSCHGEIRERIAQGQGFHGRIPAAERGCESCHHEHHGRDFALVDWGARGREGFEHARTGWALKGKHAGLACARCHEPRLVVAPPVRAMIEKQPGRKTLLGAPAACAGCHFDEHRGQEGTDCHRCHGEQGWKPAPLFSHARTSYPLEGKHRQVSCERCHPRAQDATTPADAFPHPVSKVFLRLHPVEHASCLDCHKDPHAGRFGSRCQECHTAQSWKRVVGQAAERTFHEKTRYPLRGGHRTVACEACHGPAEGQRARYRGLAFAACTDCHGDSHLGQLARQGGAGVACERCHTVEGYLPPRFELEDHARTRYPLEGGHRAVACERCHRHDPRLAEQAQKGLERGARPPRVSLAVLALGAPGDRCQACHRDVHAGQFAGRLEASGCAACHGVASFHALRFDHQKESRFPLSGKHLRAACGSCHRPAENAAREVRYRPMETACAACHADPHTAQFAPAAAGPGGDCARCHGAEDWRKLLFVHQPPFTSFLLEGKHARLACAACHAEVAVGQGLAVRRYRGVPSTCQGCHVDFHRGAFRGFEP